MKAKTQFQKRVVQLSKKLPKITKAQEAWAYDNCFPKQAFRTKHQINCLECGHSWKEGSVLISQLAGNTCPKCRKELKVKVTNDRTFKEMIYFAVLDIVEDLQLIRVMAVHKKCKVGTKAENWNQEVMQFWISQKGKVEWLFRNTAPAFIYYDSWAYGSEMLLRGSKQNQKFSICPHKIHPAAKILPIIRRNGFKGGYHGYAPQNLFWLLLSNQKAETLFKAKQYSLMGTIGQYESPVEKYWPSIKICLRNNYTIKDAGTWKDYLDLLVMFGKDLHSSKYVCPVNLHAAHDHYVRKRRAQQEKERRERMMRQIEEYQPIYEKEKGRYLGLCFVDGEIKVKTLDTVSEFKSEGDFLGHCVFTNEYFKKKNTLILSARINEIPIETIELSLNPLSIQQSRGKGNKATKHHDRIIDIVQRNIPEIKKRMRIHAA